jgi:hypothetical protein
MLNPYPWYFESHSHSILNLLPMVFWPPTHGIKSTLPMAFWHHIHGILTLTPQWGKKTMDKGFNIPWVLCSIYHG